MDIVIVIIPTFNRFKYLLNTIKSVKEQTYSNIEIILMDDCSDNSDMIKDYISNFPLINYQRSTTSGC